MTNYLSHLLAPTRPRPAIAGRLATITALAVCALALLTTAAGAQVTTVSGTSVGLQSRNGTSFVDGAVEIGEGGVKANPGAEEFANVNGNAVLHGTHVHVIYWDPRNLYHHEWLVKIDTFFQQMGVASGALDSVFADLGQYRDRSNVPALNSAVFKGAYSDTAKYPTSGNCADPKPLAFGAVTCLTDAQIREQLQSFIAGQGLPKGMGEVYDVLTPPGVTVCVDAAGTHCSDYALSEEEEEEEEHNSLSYKQSFCSYHADINPDNAAEGDGNTILYSAIPWTAGYLRLSGFVPSSFAYESAYDCQDGGFDPTTQPFVEEREAPRVRSTSELEQITKEAPKRKEEIAEEIRLEGPHQEEPNQEGKAESGEYSAGLADLIINQAAQEQENTITDPLLNGWQDPAGHEVTDECRNFFASTAGFEKTGIEGNVKADLLTEAGTLSNQHLGSGSYYINNTYSLSKHGCVGGVGLVPRFTSPNPVNSNEIVDFDGMESTVGLIEGLGFAASGPPSATYATFSWNFGDGTPEVKGYAPGAPTCEAPWLSPCAASVFHAYQYGGQYTVKLRITDVAGNITEVSHEVTVDGPPAPAPGSMSGSNGSTTGSTGGAKGGPGAIVNPLAQAAVLSRSLHTSLKKGLTVRYSVNEQVAGHFEVLISRSLAKRLKLGGAPATGLPAGTPPQLMIAKAVLITTKGGHGTVQIKFSKAVAQRLSHAHKVPLLLRLIVRNASKSPVSTTVLSSVTLG